jgi:hypothetical protein
MESSYEIINSRNFPSVNKFNQTTPNSQIKNRTNSFNKDRNNNPSQSAKIANQKIPHNAHKDEFNPVKISNKLELEAPTYWVDKTNKKEHALKLYSMQQMHHNVDLVIHTYISKVSYLNFSIYFI